MDQFPRKEIRQSIIQAGLGRLNPAKPARREWSIQPKIHDCDALKNYDRIKADLDKVVHERDEANRAHEDVVRQIAGLQDQLSRTLEATQEKDRLLAESLERERALETKSAGLEAETREFREFKVVLRDSEGLTLDEVAKRAVAAKEAEIARRVEVQVEARKKEIEADLPRLTAVRLHEILNRQPWPPEIKLLVNGHVWELLRDHSSWPLWFTLQISNDVNTRVQAGLDQEFERRVSAEVEISFENSKAGEWMKYVDERAQGMLSSVQALLRSFVVSGYKPCDRCGGNIPFQIDACAMAELLGPKASVALSCPHGCMDRVFLFKEQWHKVVLTFSEVLAMILGAGVSR